MPRLQRSNSRRSNQQADQASSPIRNLRIPSTTPRRSLFRRHQQQQLPPIITQQEEDRYRNLRRSARIAQHHRESPTLSTNEINHPANTAMADVARRTYARNDMGPRSVDSRRSTTRTSNPTPTRTPYTLTILTSPHSNIPSNTTFNTTLLITTSSPHTPSSLLCVCSLISDTPGGPRPLPAGYLQGSKLMEGVRPATRGELGRVPRERREEVLGAVTFGELWVQRGGEYRVRVTLARMVGDAWESVAEVDSGVFRVGDGGRAVNGKC